MNYSKIIKYDTANSHGYSITIWVCGCPHRCTGCFNPELWYSDVGYHFTDKTIEVICNNLQLPHINNLVILGGEPLVSYNKDNVIALCKKVKEQFPQKDIIIYTGYSFEELPLTQEEAQYIDYIIDGPFIDNQKIKTPQLRGSYNQRCWRRGDLGWYDYSDIYFDA